MATVYYDDEADLGPGPGISARSRCWGYGSQGGHAHALNLLRLWLRGAGRAAGRIQVTPPRLRRPWGWLSATPVIEACAWADVVMVLTPDTGQRRALYADAIGPNLKSGDALVLRAWVQHSFRVCERARGCGCRDGGAEGARASGAAAVRGGAGDAGTGGCCAGRDREGVGSGPVLCQGDRGDQGRGALVNPDRSKGGDRERPCSGSRRCCAAGLLPLVNAGFETLVATAAYQPEVAYFECLHELEAHRRPDGTRAA